MSGRGGLERRIGEVTGMGRMISKEIIQ
jgi:hypothetical protein